MRKRKGFTPLENHIRQKRTFLAGLTLIELLVAILIFSIIVVSLYSAFSVGLAAYNKGEKVASFYQRIRLSLNSIALDFRNSYRFSDKDAKFVVENGKVSLFTLKPIYLKGKVESLQICKVEYWQDEEKLFRKICCGPLAFSDEPAAKPEVLLDNIASFRVEFPYESEENNSFIWKDYWKEVDKLPLAVKISLQISEPESKVRSLVLTKAIFLPCGKLGKEEK